MATMTFDTHAFVKELMQAGMPEAQAEVLARSQAVLIDKKLATKRDLKELDMVHVKTHNLLKSSVFLCVQDPVEMRVRAFGYSRVHTASHPIPTERNSAL